MSMEGSKNRWKTNRWVRLALLLIVVVSLGSIWQHYASTPEGVYYDANIGTIGPSYFVLKDGKAYLQMPEDSPRFMGRYSKFEGHWMTDGIPGQGQYFLKPTVFGLKLVDPTDSSMDRFLPRRAFAWLNDFWNKSPE